MAKPAMVTEKVKPEMWMETGLEKPVTHSHSVRQTDWVKGKPMDLHWGLPMAKQKAMR
jgi:hypothetical protein